MNRKVSVAPMMDCTDRHERYFLRLISKNVLLYTEMVVSEAIDRGSVISLFGAIGFLITGSYLKTDLPLSIGFINIPAFLIFIPITMVMARVGANTVQKIDKSKLQRFFGIFLYLVGTVFLYRFLTI